MIIKTLKEHFSNKTISEIYVSHYHFDHSENAPELQNKIYISNVFIKIKILIKITVI